MRFSLLALPLLLACQAAPRDCPPSREPPPASLPASPAPTPPPPSTAAVSTGSPASAPERPLPSPLRSGNQVNQPTDLEEVNRWATAAGVRDSLLDWVTEGLATEDKGTEVTIAYVGAESPVTAVATVTLDGDLDDSTRGERFVLKFSRKACSTCPGGMSGWWLWEMDVTRRCQKGRGHDGFAKEPCL